MVLYIVYVFCSNIKWKMAATAGLSLTMNPMGKVSQNASSLKPHGSVLKHFSHRGSNVKLNPAVAAILNFISEQKTSNL
jgi:hypothetical protein